MKFKKTTIKDFNALKVLQEAGMERREAGQAIGKSYDTARRVYMSETWEDYQNDLKRINGIYKKGEKKTPRVTEEKSSTPATSPTTSITPAKDLQEDIVELILAINNLTQTIQEKKRRIF